MQKEAKVLLPQQSTDTPHSVVSGSLANAYQEGNAAESTLLYPVSWIF